MAYDRTCPPQVEDMEKDQCLTADIMDDFYDVLDDIIYKTNVHLLAEGSAALQDTWARDMRITEYDPPKKEIEFNDWNSIYTVLESVIATGRTPKLMYDDTTEEVWPDPTSEPEVAKWESCDGYWTNIQEVYDCLDCPTSAESPADRIDESQDECLTYNMVNCLWLALNCIASGACDTACRCPYCSPDECGPCRSCLTVVMTIDEYIDPDKYYSLFVMHPKVDEPASELSICDQYYPDWAAENYTIRDENQVGTPYSVGRTFWMTANDMYCRLIPASFGVGEPTIQRAHGNTSIEEGCGAWDGEIQFDDPKSPHSSFSKSLIISHPASGVVGEIELSVYVGGPPINHPYHKGNAYSYTVTNYADITVPDDSCPAEEEPYPPLWDGEVTGGGPWTGNGMVDVNHQITADLTFNYAAKAYELTLTCHGFDFWKGIKRGCGGPSGLYKQTFGEDGPDALTVEEA